MVTRCFEAVLGVLASPAAEWIVYLSSLQVNDRLLCARSDPHRKNPETNCFTIKPVIYGHLFVLQFYRKEQGNFNMKEHISAFHM